MSLLDDVIDNMANAGNGTGTGGIGPGMQASGALLDAVSNSMHGANIISKGRQQYEASQYQAAQLLQNANSAIAVSQRSAQDQQLQTDYLISKAIAISASGGGGVQDPTVVNTVARIAGEGAYRQSVALYGGSEQARLDTMQAEGQQYMGNSALKNAKLDSAAAILNTSSGLLRYGEKVAGKTIAEKNASSLYAKYGLGGPSKGMSDA